MLQTSPAWSHSAARAAGAGGTVNNAASRMVPASTAGARTSRAAPCRKAPPMLAPPDRVISAPNPNIIQRYNRPLAGIHSGVVDGNTEGTDSRPSLWSGAHWRGGGETDRRPARIQDRRRG